MPEVGSLYCADCDTASPTLHRLAWFENAFDALLPTPSPRFFNRSVVDFFEWLMESALRVLGLVHLDEHFSLETLPRRTTLFIEAARKRNIIFMALRGPWGYTNNFRMQVNGKTFRFEGLPNVGWLNGPRAAHADDKGKVKKLLAREGFPVAEGRTFWQWHMRGALRYGTYTLGFPLVVKPRNGSVARHVTINITSEEQLRHALHHAFSYSPVAIVERYVPGFVHRFTVVDNEHVFCVRQIPAHVDGDGKKTITALVAEKNAAPERQVDNTRSATKPFYAPITIGAQAEKVLVTQGYTSSSIPSSGTRVWLAEDPFMRNGGDLEEVTGSVHEDNRSLALNVAKLFGMKLVALDFVCEDTSRSWKEQSSAILELNSLPSIEMHHLASYGKQQDVAGAIADMAVRYYR